MIHLDKSNLPRLSDILKNFDGIQISEYYRKPLITNWNKNCVVAYSKDFNSETIIILTEKNLLKSYTFFRGMKFNSSPKYKYVLGYNSCIRDVSFVVRLFENNRNVVTIYNEKVWDYVKSVVMIDTI